MPNADLLKLTISELAPMIQTRKVSLVELTEAALAQAHKLQPVLNSFITILDEQAMNQAHEMEDALAQGDYRGPLHGIPIGIKDNIATAGIRTTSFRNERRHLRPQPPRRHARWRRHLRRRNGRARPLPPARRQLSRGRSIRRRP